MRAVSRTCVRRVLVCAATRAERDACERGIAGAAAPAGFEHEVLLTGVGPVRAARALDERLGRGAHPDLVVSSGFAGTLSTTLALSSWITAARLAADPGERVTKVEAYPGLIACEVRSSMTLVKAAAAPRSAGRDDGLPIAVDMESVALAHEAARRGVSFSVARLVSDTPSDPLPDLLSPITSALAATRTLTRLGFAARGVRAALADPRGLVRLLADGPTWLRRLEEGWRSFASVRT
ncbi:MAG: rane protein-like protein [Labilithrix sp.]|nr:rane protein-like protein [Labilithrix sp.]